MKKSLVYIVLYAIALCFVSILYSCTVNPKTDDTGDTDKVDTVLPLNISVYLDLSDRLTRALTPSQMERDTAIINNLIDIFIDDCINNGKIVNSNNHFQVFFYPTPNSSNVALLAKGMNIDLAKIPIQEKKMELMNMKDHFQTYLAQIYTDTMNESKWVGSDVWGFFSNHQVDKLCIRKGYRNILVILTDGFLFHVDNKIKQGNAYSYILPQTLQNPNSSLIVKRKGLSDLEVLMLEVNPYELKQRDQLITILENWFKEMEVAKFIVNETALPVNTDTYINSFIND